MMSGGSGDVWLVCSGVCLLSGECLGGVWWVSGGCLGASGGVWGVLDGVWMVFSALEKKIIAP